MSAYKRRCFWIADSTKKYSIFSQYEIKQELGRGPNSIVYLCQRKGLPDLYSVKCMRKNISKKVLMADAGTLLKLDHRNLVRLQEIFESVTKIYVVQELIMGENLLERIANISDSSYTELMVTKFVRDIVQGLKYLHFCGIAVKNLKPENLFFHSLDKDAHIQISDFIMSTIVSPEVLLSSISRCPYYTAPEVLKNLSAEMPCDLWSLGSITYILLFGVEPFYHDDPVVLYKRIIKGHYEMPSNDQDDISLGAKEFLHKLLTVDVKKRITIEMAYFNYWVNSINVKTIPMNDVVEKIKTLNTVRKHRAKLIPITISFAGAPAINEGYLFLVEEDRKIDQSNLVPPNSVDDTADGMTSMTTEPVSKMVEHKVDLEAPTDAASISQDQFL